MRMNRNTFAFVGALLLVPALALAAPQATAAKTDQKPKAATKAAAKAATHSTTGVVQSVSDTSLVIAKTSKGKTSATETFVLNGTTVKKGDVVVGAKVGVRYIAEGGQNVATAVTVTAKGKGKDIPKSSR
jgi:hypothetical protein